MFRLIGFLLGSGVSIAVLLVLFDGPDLLRARKAAEQSTALAAEQADDIEPSREQEERTQRLEASVTPPQAVMPETSAPAAPVLEPPEAARLATDEPAETSTPVDTQPIIPAGVEIGNLELQWQPVWYQFHSEISAQGFTRRLERLTGLDYRVTVSAPGKYQVAFAHSNQDERLINLAKIEAATGLRLRDPAP